MAEDEVLDEIPEEEEGVDKEPLPPKQRQGLKKCNQRIDELATPPKRIFLSLWNEHAYHFPDEKVNDLKQLLQRLYAMTPEESAKYFAELRAQARAAAKRKKMKQALRKYLTEKNNKKQRNRAYRMFRKILKRGLRYAVETPVPPVLSIRLRYLSDIILEQLCELRGLEVPDRTKCDHCGQFLISVADWIAIAVERLYYNSQLAINKITDNVKSEALSQEIPTYDAMGPPAASSTPRSSVQREKNSSFGPPIASSTKKNSIILEKSVSQSLTKHESASDFIQDDSGVEKLPFYCYTDMKGKAQHPSFNFVTNSFYQPQQFKELTNISQSEDKPRKRRSLKKKKSSAEYSNSAFSKNTTKRIDSLIS